MPTTAFMTMEGGSGGDDDSSSVQPTYGIASCAPSYTSLPLADEATMEYTPRPGIPVAGGTVTRKWKNAAVTFRGQEDGIRYPIYGRAGLVAGELELKRPESLLKVSVKLEGQITLSVSDVGARVMRVVQEQAILWEKGEGISGTCPGMLPFALQFPSRFTEDRKSWKLPPSFETRYLGIPALYSRCTYTFSVVLRRAMDYRVVSWVRHKAYSTPVVYRPRIRASRPVPRFDSMFSSVKSLPEEWTQLVSTMGVRAGSTMKPVDCHFLIPAASTYSLTDSIPFHIQLSSSLGTLRELLPPSCCLLRPASKTETKALQGESPIRVYLARQVTVELNGKETHRTLTLGTGTVWPVPPTDFGRTSASPDDIFLDWEGETKCSKEVMCGGFYVGSLSVKDYLVFALGPRRMQNSHLMPLQIAHPVRFVSDPWIENEEVHPREYEF